MAILDHGQKQRTRDVPSPGLTTPDRIQKQIIGVLREHEVGAKAADLARKHGVSEATIYAWKQIVHHSTSSETVNHISIEINRSRA